MIRQLKSVHFWIDVICITTLVIVLSMFGITFKENLIGMCSITLLAVALGLNGYASGMKDGIALFRR